MLSLLEFRNTTSAGTSVGLSFRFQLTKPAVYVAQCVRWGLQRTDFQI